MPEELFGPEYPKIETVYLRDERKLIIPGAWTTDEFRYLADCEWRWTEKVDGTNIRVHWNGERVTVGGRTDSAQVPTFLLAALQPLLEPGRFAAIFPDGNATLYGEGYGPKIQGGHQYRDDPTLILFDVRVGAWWLKPDDIEDVASKLGLEVVPPKGCWTLRDAVARVEAELLYSHWTGARIEGLVGTPTVSLFDRAGHRIVAKIKGKDFADLRRRGGPRA